jgi:hypothetical protein
VEIGWGLIGKVFAGMVVFGAILIAGRRPEAIFQRAAGMLLTFPALNGIALVMTETSRTAEKAAVMFPLIYFNGLMFFGFMLNFERLEILRRAPLPWVFAATVVWLFAAVPGFYVPMEWQGAYILDHRFHETGLMHGIHLASEAL